MSSFIDNNDYWDSIERDAVGRKYSGSTGSVFNGGGRKSYEYYPKYLIQKIEEELAKQQGYEYIPDPELQKKKRHKQQTEREAYEDTIVSKEKSMREIEELLIKYNCSKPIWNSSALFFKYQILANQMCKSILIRVKIPHVSNELRAYRILYHHIKAKLIAIKNDVDTFENIFMSEIIIPMGDGYTTIGELARVQYLGLPSSEPP